MKLQKKSRIKYYVLIIICVLAGAFLLCQSMIEQSARKINEKLFEANSQNLEDTYTEVCATFTNTAKARWYYLEALGFSFSVLEENESWKIKERVEQLKEKYEFTEFYLVSESGEYRTLGGDKGHIDLGSNLSLLMKDRERIVTDGSLPRSDNMMFYAVPVETAVFNGFEYSALAFGYDRNAMADIFKVDAYGGRSSAYIIYTNGRIAASSDTTALEWSNILDAISQYGIPEEIMQKIEQDIKNSEKGTYEIWVKGEPCYLHYCPIGFQNWMMASVTPVEEVNFVDRDIQETSAHMMAVIFSIIFALITGGLLILLIRSVRSKNSEVAKREQLFELMSSNMDTVYVMMNRKDWSVSYVSPNVKRLLGIASQRVREDFTLLGTGDSGSEKWNDAGYLSKIAPGDRRSLETEMVNPDTNAKKMYRITIVRPKAPQHNVLVLAIADMTVEQKARQQIIDALNMAETANQSKTTFLSNMSHDIRTPMNAIVGFSALLSRDAEHPEKVREYARKIAASSQHLLGLINDILDMSKIESGKTSLNISELNIAEVIEELDMIIRPQAKAKSQEFIVVADNICQDMVLGDKVRLNQILLNILSNAVKYTGIGGKIELKLEGMPQRSRDFARYRFTVSDNGIGMSKEYLQTIFDSFTREENSTTNKVQGTGLGMAITKNLVELMGGNIYVTSKPGGGSTFVITLELRTAAREDNAQFWKKHGITHTLVVGDEVEVCQNIVNTMTGIGIRTEFALDDITALEMLKAAVGKEDSYNMVLVDWKMPGRNGAETVRQIRETIPEHIPIMILTAYDRSESEEEAYDAGVDALLPKPFFLSNFQRKVEQIESRSQAEKEETVYAAGLKGMHFLVAEDNEINAEILEELLEMEGADCDIMENGEACLRAFEASEPGQYDMILMDVQMPVMNGYEATKAIRQSSHPMAAAIPVIAMTANAFSEDVQDALNAGMNAHMAKPVDMELLAQVIQKLHNTNERSFRKGRIM